MEKPSGGGVCLCALDGVMDLLGKKWTLLVINAIGELGVARYKVLQDELLGISPSVLAETLRELEASGIVKRTQYPVIPPKVEYSLTEEGVELRRAIVPLLLWADRRNTVRKVRKCSPSLYLRMS